MRGRYVLRATQDKEIEWDLQSDNNIARITWEDIDPRKHEGCTKRMRWRIKPSKRGQEEENDFEKDLSCGPLKEQSVNKTCHQNYASHARSKRRLATGTTTAVLGPRIPN